VEDATEKNKPEVLGGLSCGWKVGSFLSLLKTWRVKKSKVKLTLGWDVGMAEVDLLSKHRLVGKFGYWALGV